MVTRRDALILIGTLPAGIAVLQADAVASSSDIHRVDSVPDRELTLTLSDNLDRQSWFYAGQRYEEYRDRIVAFEGERLRLKLVNDTLDSRALTFDSATIQLTPGQTAMLELTVDKLESKVFRDARGVLRVIEVRPSYQFHALV